LVSGFNYEALAVFVRLGFFLGETTPWIGHRIALPRGMNDAAKRTLWDPPEPVETVRGRTRSDLVDGYIELFRQATSRLLPKEAFALPLSGGADSRHILLELVRQGHAPRITLTAARSAFDPDVAIARAVSEHLSVPHRVISTPPSYAAELEKNHLTAFQTDEHAWVPAFGRALRELTRESYDGIGGDILSAGGSLSPRRLRLASDPEAFAEDVMWPEPIIRAALAPEFYELVPRHVAKSAIVAEYRRRQGEANPIGAFIFRNQMRGETALAPFSLLCPTIMHTPYLDPDLVHFLRTIPAEEFAGPKLHQGTLHQEAIHTAFPASRHIPFDKDRVASLRRRLPLKLYQRTKAVQLVRQATASPRLSRSGALLEVGKRRFPVMFAKRMAWIAQLPGSPSSGVTARDQSVRESEPVIAELREGR
jgi:asparagine synthase (glutamine-hydrolysing)